MVNKMEEVNLIWKKIETQWPVPCCIEQVSFNTIKDKMEKFLFKKEIFPQAFSHFGFVVNNIEGSIKILKKFDGRYSGKIIKDWVEAFRVYVGRIIFNNKELEFIAPEGESFFNVFLKEEGEGLHHLAFQVNDVKSCLEKLKAYGVELIDKEPRSGSHGEIVFLMPGLFGKMCIELCQKHE
jgi:methylmalonyl-CoA epimerase